LASMGLAVADHHHRTEQEPAKQKPPEGG